MEKKKIVFIVVLMTILITGLFLWFQFGAKSPNGQTKQGITVSEKTVPEAIPEVKIISGTVRAVSGSTITFKAFPFDGKDTDDIRTIDVAGVPMFKYIPFSPEEMQKKMEEQLVQLTPDPMSPSEREGIPEDPFSKKAPATLAEMKPGDVVTVVSDTDIRDVKEIKPKEITFVYGSQIAYPEGYQP